MKAAAAAFLELGYDATRISDIVARAAVAQGTFYLHFESKAAVYLAITGAMTSEMLARTTSAITDAGSLAEAIDRGIEAAFDSMIDQRELLKFIARSPLLPEVRQQTSEMTERALAVSSARIREAIDCGQISGPTDPEISARLIHGAIDFAARYYLDADADTLARARRETRAFAFRALGLAETGAA
ncbi:TetR/AcrR family transcriptional regulator [Sphingomonas oryzagri]